MAKKLPEPNEYTIWHFVLGMLALVIGFAKGFSDGLGPPPGDRRG